MMTLTEGLSIAIIAGVVSIVTALITSIITVWKVRREFLLEHQSESLVRKLLNNKRWKFRTFRTIKYHVAGFEDDELRQILIKAGAVRFQDNHGEEIWGLIERCDDLLGDEVGTGQN